MSTKFRTPKHLIQAHRLICGRDKLRRKAHSQAEYNHLAEIRGIFADSNIVGLGIAEKLTNGKPVGELTLCFYVKKKKAKKRLGSSKMIPPVISVGGGKAIFTDVYEESSPFEALTNAKRSPIQSGFSVGTEVDVHAGTVGAVVSFGTKRYVLSNSHVLDGIPDSTEIAYPAIEDNNNQTNRVGILRHIVPLVANGNRADAALAEINSEVNINPTISGAITPYSVVIPTINMNIVGNGRTTTEIRGLVRVTNFHGPVTIAGAKIGFDDQVVCAGKAAKGDSGSIMVAEDTREIVGLLFAASDGEFMLSPIAAVRQELKVNFKFVNLGS